MTVDRTEPIVSGVLRCYVSEEQAAVCLQRMFEMGLFPKLAIDNVTR